MGLVKTRRLARHSLALGVFASPWVANPRKGRLRDAEAAARKGGPEIPSAESHPAPSLPPPATPALI